MLYIAGFTQVREKSVNFEFDIKSGRSQGILIYSMPNKHSTYDYGSLLKIVRKKNRIEHPIFSSFIFILLLIAFIYFKNTTCIKPSQKTEMSLRSLPPELLSGLRIPCGFPAFSSDCIPTFIIKQYGGSDEKHFNLKS